MAYTQERIIELDQEAHDLTDELMQLSAALDKAREDLKNEFESKKDEMDSRAVKPYDYEVLDMMDGFNKRMIAIKDTHKDILNLLRHIGASYERGAEDLDLTIHDPHFIERMDAVRIFVEKL